MLPKISKSLRIHSTIRSRFFCFMMMCTMMLSCGKKTAVQVDDFSALTNYQPEVKNKEILFDYTNAIDSGFVIPSAAQTVSGYFQFHFRLINTGSTLVKYYYKIYYQNESYFFPEKNEDGSYNEFSSENFYGSWENRNDSIKSLTIEPGKHLDI